jgi:hypothetical protein
MDPVFTLQWPEFILANRLQKLLPKKEGYSVLSGRPDRMFGFGFSHLSSIFQTRGDKNRSMKDFSDFLFEKRIKLIKEALNG